jgi:hypothetical protein
LHRIDIDGNRAKISVAPWSGPLVIDAQLEGHKSAHATATADGPHEVVLTLEARPATNPTTRHTAPATAPARTTLDINTSR